MHTTTMLLAAAGAFQRPGAMTVVVAGWLAMGVIWLATAIWFAVRWRASGWGKVRHFLVSLFPEPWLLVLLPLVAVLVNLVPRAVWGHLTFAHPVVVAIGAGLVLLSAPLMIWARLALGAMWAGRPMVQEDHELRTGGPYRLVRHPIYTGLLGMMLGTAMASGAGSFIVIVACTLVWLLWRVRVEDGMMARVFGDDFRAYQSRVPALLPLRVRHLTHSFRTGPVR
jgi:protein-S-isoprenylcysteine O-methyltransferase Ste14